MPDYAWPDAEHRTLLGTRVTRVDAPAKVSGQAKYTYDVHRPGMLYGKVLRCPYAHAKVVSIDTSAAEKMPGVKAVHIVQAPGANIHWAGDDIVAVAAVDEPTAEDAIRAIKVKYQPLPHLVSDAEPPKGAAEEQGPLSMDAIGDMLDNQVPTRQMVDDIGKYGVTEKPSEDVLKELKTMAHRMRSLTRFVLPHRILRLAIAPRRIIRKQRVKLSAIPTRHSRRQR